MNQQIPLSKIQFPLYTEQIFFHQRGCFIIFLSNSAVHAPEVLHKVFKFSIARKQL